MVASTTYYANKNMTAEAYSGGGVMEDFSIDLVQDAKDRMTSWSRSGTGTGLDSQDWTLSFESNWDETTTTDGGVATTQPRTHNAAHELLTFDPDGPGPLPTISMTHDPKGNMTGDSFGALVGTYDFDNMLQQGVVSLLSPVGTPGTHSYTYDALGRRIAKTVDTDADFTPDETTIFVYAGQQIFIEYEGGAASATPHRKYLYCATCYIDEPIALVNDNENVFYYHRDRSYNIIGMIDDTGAIVELYAYTLYGQRTIFNASWTALSASAFGNFRGFQGLRHDPETGLIENRARVLDPLTGRFLQRDPLGYPDGLNGYAAYHVMWGGVDPSGKSSSTSKSNIYGKDATVVSFIAKFDPANIDKGEILDAYEAATGKSMSIARQTKLDVGLDMIAGSANPNPPNSLDGNGWRDLHNSKEYRGYSWIQPSICCSNGKVVSYNKDRHGFSLGYTPLRKKSLNPDNPFTVTYSSGEGFNSATASKTDGDMCVEFVVKNNFRLGLVAQIGSDILTGSPAPYVQTNMTYKLCCDKSYSVSYYGTNFPTHYAYFDNQKVYEAKQDGLGKFMFAQTKNNGGATGTGPSGTLQLTPGRTFHTETGSLP